jgi:nitrogen fixation protein NifX
MTVLKRQFQVLSDADDGTLLKVAFATSNSQTVDQHFGSAQSFAIYGVNPESTQLLGVSEFGRLEQDGNEDKLAAKIDMLDGCVAVYCRACGASAVRQLLASNVQPIKVGEDATIVDLLAALQAELREGPSSWLAKAIERQRGPDQNRFDAMAAEGWDE